MTADLEELGAALRRADADAFRVVAERLARQRLAAVREPLLQALQDHDPAIRAAAAAAAGHLDHADAVDPLFLLLQDPEPGVRADALAALIRLGPGLLEADLRAAPAGSPGRHCLRDLVHLLRDEPAAPYPAGHWPDAVNGVAARAVKLCIALLHHADSAVRVRAAELLGATQDRRAVDELLRVLTHDDPATRIAAAVALGEHGKTSRVVPLLVEAFHDPSPRVRTAVALALSRFDALSGDIPGDRMRPVVEHLLRHPDVEARRRVILMLGRSRGLDANGLAVDLLLSALDDREASVRAEGIVALSRATGTGAMEARDPRIEPALRIALTDADEMVRLRAVDALDRLGAAEPLPLALRDPSPLVRVQALKALRWTGAEPVLPELLASLRDPAEAVRLEVVELLAGHPTPVVITALIEAVPRESFPLLRQKMLALIGKHGDGHAPAPRDVFRAFLDDPALEVRAQVVQYLGDLGDPNLLTDLIPRAADDAIEVRVALVKALERLGNPVSLRIGHAFLADAAAEVRDAAVWALRIRPANEGLRRALPLLDDPAELVRLSVAVLLATFHSRGEFSLEQLRAVHTTTALPGRLALLEMCEGIRDRRLVPLLLAALQQGATTTALPLPTTEQGRALQILTELKRGDQPRRHPRVPEELPPLAFNGVAAPRGAQRGLESVPAAGFPVLEEAIVFRVSAPARLAPGTPALIQLWAALPEQLERLETLANRPLDESDYRIQSKFGPGLTSRLALSAVFHGAGLEIIDAEDDLYWDGPAAGHPCAARFLVRVPQDALPGERAARVTIHRDGIPIAEVATTLEIGPAAAPVVRECRLQHCRQIEVMGEARDEGTVPARVTALRRVVPWLAKAPVTIRSLVPGSFADTALLWAYLRGRIRA